MSEVVKLKEVVDTLDSLMEGFAGYVNRKTGKVVMLTERDLELADGDHDPEELLDWEQQARDEARAILENDDYLVLPDSFDIHSYAIMEQFCMETKNPEWRNELLNAIRGRGAFGRFKHTAHRLGILEDWYGFHTQALEEIAIEWLEGHEISYQR